jgi:hypothetical protein
MQSLKYRLYLIYIGADFGLFTAFSVFVVGLVDMPPFSGLIIGS